MRLTWRRADGAVCPYVANGTDYDYILGEFTQKIYDKLAAYEDAEEQGLLVRTPYRVGDLFWAVAYSDPRVIRVRLYQITYHHKYGWVLWVENIDNENDWWKVPLKEFEAWSCFDSYEEAEAELKGLKGETEDV